MKRSFLLLTAALAAISGRAQIYKTDTAFTTHVGSGGSKASGISRPLGTNFGINANRDGAFMVAEDFTVPSGQTWNLDTVIVYAYQTNSPTSSSITGATLQITSGSVTGSVVFGDTTTNRLVASGWTGIYRMDTSLAAGGPTSVARPIMYLKIKLTPTKSLTAGTYWMEWGARGSTTLTGPWAPPKVLPGLVNPTGQNGMQRTPTAGWIAAKDSTASGQQNLGFPYILKGPATTGIAGMNAQVDFGLRHYPNPVTQSAMISFHLHHNGPVKLNVYSNTGQLIRTLVDGELTAGPQKATFEVAGLPAGLYYYRLKTEEGEQTKMMEVLK